MEVARSLLAEARPTEQGEAMAHQRVEPQGSTPPGSPTASVATVRSVPRRRAFCPLCGGEQQDKLASEVATAEAALCAGRCTVAWQVLTALRLSESGNEQVVARRREEWEAREPHAATLSEILLGRWRAGDWAVAPEDLLGQLR
jgi:hypothetical protein